jgi:hypothetical protein
MNTTEIERLIALLRKMQQEQDDILTQINMELVKEIILEPITIASGERITAPETTKTNSPQHKIPTCRCWPGN